MALLTLGSTQASSCPPFSPPDKDISASQHIFIAQIKTSTLSADKKSIEAMFTVEEVLKGDPNPVSAIRADFSDYNYSTDGAPMTGGNIEVSPGTHLLVFASGPGPVTYGACGPTTRLSRHDAASIQSVRKALNLK